MKIDIENPGSSILYPAKVERQTDSSKLQRRLPNSALQDLKVRVQAEAKKTQIAVSAVGDFKSAVSTLKLAADRFSTASTTQTAQTLMTGADSLFSGISNAVSKMKDLVKTGGDSVSMDFFRQLARTETFDTSTRDKLKQIGVSIDLKGAISVDKVKLNSAVRTNTQETEKSLKALSQAIQLATSRVLDDGGSIQFALAKLAKKTLTLESQQKAIDRANIAVSRSPLELPFGGTGYSMY